MNALDSIKRDEGFMAEPYYCTANKKTIGYGRNLDDNPLTNQEKEDLRISVGLPKGVERDFNQLPLSVKEAEYLLKNDLNGVLKQVLKLDYYAELNPARRAVIINMVFNLGICRFKKFLNMNDALNKKDYELAAAEMLDSRWSKQVGARATRLSDQMRAG